MTTSVLAIDVGNTRVKCGLLRSDDGTLPTCVEVVAIANNQQFDWNQVHHAIAKHSFKVDRCVVSGSNPVKLKQLLSSWPNNLDRPYEVTNAEQLDVVVAVDEPAAVGLDRVLNAIAVNAIRDSDQPAVVIDSGTATTIDLVDAAGNFAGGTILPGIELSATALHHYTALLPLISMSDLDVELRPPGLNTRAAIQNGILYGHVGAVKEIVAQLDPSGAAECVLTGGAGQLLTPHLPAASFVPYLSLRALGLV